MGHFRGNGSEHLKKVSLALRIEKILKEGASLGVAGFRCMRTVGAKGKKLIKIRRDGNGGILVTTTEPGVKKDFAVLTEDPQDTIAQLGKHCTSQGLPVAYK